MADEGERCQVCGDAYMDVYWLPDGWWELVTPKPEHPDAGLLCPPCALSRLMICGALSTLPADGVAGHCPTCGGDGWVIDHEVECYESGDYIGCGGRQVQCEDPRGHADTCTRCDGLGNVWAGDGPGFCRHCVGGWVWRGTTPAGWREETGDAGAHDVATDDPRGEDCQCPGCRRTSDERAAVVAAIAGHDSPTGGAT